MTRRTCLAALPVFVLAAEGITQAAQQPSSSTQQSQQAPQQSTPAPQQVPDAESLPEDDENEAPEKFVLNPLESERNIRVGNYYWHRGKMRAALNRYERATKFNPSSAEAFFKVAEAEEKLENMDAARIALKRVVDLSPDSKLGHDAKKKLASIKS